MGVQPISVPQSLAYVLNSAGQKNGVDFDYLLKTAVRESSLNPDAKASTSSATGLFQFLESTWLQVMKQEGPRLGYGQYAAAITVSGDGDYDIADPGMKRQILDLRRDPQIASDLAAAFTKANGDYLKQRFGRMPSAGELYIAHFLGAQGAEKMFTAGLQNPDQTAAALFPKQAAANQTIFYADGHPRTIREVYRALVSKHTAASGGAGAGFAAQQMASQPLTDPAPIPSRFAPEDMSFTALFSTGYEGATGSPLLSASGAPLAAGPDEGQGEPAPGQSAAFFSQLYGQ